MDRRLRWVIMGFLCAAFVVLSPLLILYSMGYRMRGGKLQESGLILLASTPPGATVWIDGKPTNHKTPADIYRRAPGKYAVSVKLPGHREWTRTISIETQTVSRAEHIVLLPSEIEPTLVTSHPVSCFALSPDGKFLVYADTESPPRIWFRNLPEDEEEVCIVAAQGGEFPKASRATKIQISPLGRAALVTLACRGETESVRTHWLSLRDPYTLARIDPFVPGASLYRINPRAPHQVFVLSKERLCRLDVREKEVKWDISQGVETFEVTEDNLWLMKHGEPVVMARPLNSNDPADDKEVFSYDPPSNATDEQGQTMSVDGQRNAVVVLASGVTLLRGSPSSTKLDVAFKSTRLVAFSPDHLHAAVADDSRLYAMPVFPLNNLSLELQPAQPEPVTVVRSTKNDGERISKVFWWADSAHLLLQTGNVWEFAETEPGADQNQRQFLTVKAPNSEAAFDAKDAILYFTDNRETDSARKDGLFIYAAKLRVPTRSWLDWTSKQKALSDAPATPKS